MSLLDKLANKQITKSELVRASEADLRLLPLLVEGIVSAKPAVRYGCGSVLMILSAKHPDKVYPFMDVFVDLLGSKYRPLTWNALSIIANLTAADTDCKFDALFEHYFSFLGSEYMVTVANTVANSATIVTNKPYLADRIATELLKVQNLPLTPHLTQECTRVIAEKAIKIFDTLLKYTQDKAALIAFAEKHQNSSRVSLRKEAQVFLKKWQ